MQHWRLFYPNGGLLTVSTAPQFEPDEQRGRYATFAIVLQKANDCLQCHTIAACLLNQCRRYLAPAHLFVLRADPFNLCVEIEISYGIEGLQQPIIVQAPLRFARCQMPTI